MKKAGKHTYPSLGRIERLDWSFYDVIAPDAKIEVLADGFTWSEGPRWIKDGGYVVFSDVPKNTVFKWKEGEGLSTFLKPSGYTGTIPRGGEPGSNGLTTDSAGRLVLAQHGDRCIGRLEKDGSRTILAEYYNYMRFNSPNDLVYDNDGNLYFTDPPYGLEGNVNDPKKEMMYSGVFLLRRSGEVVLLTKELRFPNGIAFSPDYKTLYVGASDPKAPTIMAYNVQSDGTIDGGRLFFDTLPLVPGKKGLPDGMKVDKKGNVFTTGPGGVLVINPKGQHIGTIVTDEQTGNCAWGDDGKTLYIMANHQLCRIRTRTEGLGY